MNDAEPEQVAAENSPSRGGAALARRSWLIEIFALGIALLFVALVLQTISLVSGDYTHTLIAALALTALADLCFIIVSRCGGVFARISAVLCLLPTLFVIADFIRREGPWLVF